MSLLQVFTNENVPVGVAGALGGIVITWLTQRLLNKRGVFSYFVNHSRVGVSTNDPILGTVAVSWNGTTIPTLYLSTIEMKNESFNDYENVLVRAYTGDTTLMTEQTQLLDSPNVLQWSENYKKQLNLAPGQVPTQIQRNILNGQREYVIPVLNRGQSIKLTYLNSPHGTDMPTIWLSVTQKGVKLKFRVPHALILGVPQHVASRTGVAMGIAVVIALACFIAEPWLAATLALIYGLGAQVPGAYLVKLWRRIKEIIGN